MTQPQPTLFDQIPAPTDESGKAPRCRMCARPARWIAPRQQYAMYCAGRMCSNRERICQSCGTDFHMNVDGAGTKYCSLDCKRHGYQPLSKRNAEPTRCAWCGTTTNGGPPRGYRKTWPYICQTCIDPIKHVVDRLKAHRVPHERARRLTQEPGCEICGTDLLAKMPAGHGKTRAVLVVDHDHQCCPADSHSCGQCVRGLICFTCNAAAGMLKDNPDNARSLAKYLERWIGPRF